MMYLSQAYVSIRIYGDNFHPFELTKLIGLNPTDTGIKGEIGRYAPSLKECFWQFQLDKTNALEELEKSFVDLIIAFEGKINLVNGYILENDLKAKCYVVIQSKNSEDNGVVFSPEFIDFLSELNASVEVDVYNG